MQETTGAIKIMVDNKTHWIIGAELYCTKMSLLIGELAICVPKETRVVTLATTIHVHPTLTEAVMEFVKKPLGTAFHK